MAWVLLTKRISEFITSIIALNINNHHIHNLIKKIRGFLIYSLWLLVPQVDADTQFFYEQESNFPFSWNFAAPVIKHIAFFKTDT